MDIKTGMIFIMIEPPLKPRHYTLTRMNQGGELSEVKEIARMAWGSTRMAEERSSHQGHPRDRLIC